MTRMKILAAALTAAVLTIVPTWPAAAAATQAETLDHRIAACDMPTGGSTPTRDACDYDPAAGMAGSQATGAGAFATAGGYATGIGAFAARGMAGGDYSFAVGGEAVGRSSIALGQLSQATGDYSFAALAGVAGAGAIAIGNNAVAADAAGIALVDGHATGTASIAIGGTASGNHAVVVGGINLYGGGSGGWVGEASGDYSLVLGAGAASGAFAVAMANGTASGDESLAFGNGSAALVDHSVALGSMSLANRYNSVSLGDDGSTGNTPFRRQLTSLAAGTDPFDAVNLAQLNGSGIAIASWLGGGAAFGVGGVMAPPTYLIQGGNYSDVGAAFAAVDSQLTDLYGKVGTGVGVPGPQGDKGDKGDTGTDGADGINGKDGAGDGTDNMAAHYDSAARDSITLGAPASADGVTVRNLAAGRASTDAANVQQVSQAIEAANSYTDTRVGEVRDWARGYTDEVGQQTLLSANDYTDTRLRGLAERMDRAKAMGTAQTSMSANFRGRNSLSAGVGVSGGHNAFAVGYRHVTESGHVSISAHGAVAGAERAAGVGVGYSW